jgi:hypothetical protein
VSGQCHASTALYPLGKDPPSTHCAGGWVGPRAGLDTQVRGKIFGFCWGSNLDRPVVQPVAGHYTDWAPRLTPTDLYSSSFSAKILYTFLISPSYPSRFDHRNIWWRVQIINTLFTYLRLLCSHSSYLTNVRSKKNERSGRVINAPGSFWEVPGWNYGPETGYCNWDFFVAFLSHSMRIPEKYLKIRPQPLPSESFPIHYSLITLSFDAI